MGSLYFSAIINVLYSCVVCLQFYNKQNRLHRKIYSLQMVIKCITASAVWSKSDKTKNKRHLRSGNCEKFCEENVDLSDCRNEWLSHQWIDLVINQQWSYTTPCCDGLWLATPTTGLQCHCCTQPHSFDQMVFALLCGFALWVVSFHVCVWLATVVKLVGGELSIVHSCVIMT